MKEYCRDIRSWCNDEEGAKKIYSIRFKCLQASIEEHLSDSNWYRYCFINLHTAVNASARVDVLISLQVESVSFHEDGKRKIYITCIIIVENQSSCLTTFSLL